MVRRLSVLLALLVLSLHAADLIVTDFSKWGKSGTVAIAPKGDVTEIKGNMQGGELRWTFPASELSKYSYVLVERAYEQGEWKLNWCKGLDRNELTAIVPKRKILNYKLSPEMASDGTVTLAFQLMAEATVEVKSVMLSGQVMDSDGYVGRLYTGAERTFETPSGVYSIPNRFEDVTPKIYRSDYVIKLEEKDCGLRSYVVSDPMELNPRLYPDESAFQASIRLFAAPDQFETAAFSIYAVNKADAVTVRATAAVSDTGASLPAPELHYLRVWPQRLSFTALQYREVAELLEDNTPQAIEAGLAKSWFLRQYVPEGTAPGEYRGRIVYSEKGLSRELPYAIRVTGVRLVKEKDRPIGIYYGAPREFKIISVYGFNASVQGESNCMRWVLQPLVDIMKKEQDVSKRLELLYDGKDEPQLSYRNRYDKEGTTLDTFMQAYNEAGYCKLFSWICLRGFTDTIAAFLNEPLSKEPTLSIYPETLTPQYCKLFKDIIRAISTRAEKKFGVRIYWYMFDEIGAHCNAKTFAYATDMFRLVKEAGAYTAVTCTPNDDFLKQGGKYVDCCLYNRGSVGTREQIALARKDVAANKSEFNCYAGCVRELYHTLRYDSGYNTWIVGWTGKFFWNLHSQRNNPFNDFDHQHKDSMVLYTLDKKPICTLQLEYLRKGIDDFRYILTLQKLIAQAKGSAQPNVKAAGEAAEAELNHVKDSLPISIGDGVEWDCRNFDRYRWRFSCMIEALQELLAGKAAPAIEFFQAEAQKKNELIRPLYRDVPLAKGAIKVDGVLDESCWKDAATFPQPVRVETGTPGDAPTEFMALRDDSYLYIGALCHEPDVPHMIAKQMIRDHLVWRDDSVELFYSGSFNHLEHKQVVVNSLANVFDMKIDDDGKGDVSWNCPGLKVATKVGTDAWYVEIGIPLSEFSSPMVGMSLLRNREFYKSNESITDDPHNPRSYVVLNLGAVPHMELAIPREYLTGRNEAEFFSEKDGELTVSLDGGVLSRLPVKAGQKLVVPVSIGTVGRHQLEFACNGAVWRYREVLKPALTLTAPSDYYLKNDGQAVIEGRVNTILSPRHSLELRVTRDGREEMSLRVQATGNAFKVRIPFATLPPESRHEVELTLKDGSETVDVARASFELLKEI